MRLTVITPVGPGHEQYVKDCEQSVKLEAERSNRFIVKHVVVDDTKGKLGRSKARNIGMETPADWFFFLDADDRMAGGALDLCDLSVSSTFGMIAKSDKSYSFNVHPCGWKEIAIHGCYGTLSMGFFCDAGLGMRFNEELNAGEDFEFYLRLPSFTKVAVPLVDIGYDRPSAGGPRGYKKIDWVGICNREIVRAVERNPAKYDLGGHAVLEKAKCP